MTEDEWIACLLSSVVDPQINGLAFPGFPSDDVQSQFVGSTKKAAMSEAAGFYKFTKEYTSALGAPLNGETSFLDFGCGWGRFLRFFWKDVEVENLYGCDIDPVILATCRETGVPGNLDRIYNGGQLPYPDGSLGGAIAYSVFTHLPEVVHLHWMRELARVLKAGAVFCLTLEPRRFIDFMQSIPESAESDWHKALQINEEQANDYRMMFDAGQLVYIPTGGGDYRDPSVYGDAAVPREYIDLHWGPYFDIRGYIDDPNRFWQAVLVVQRR
jgi:SAM-dependent methyltransferase